MPKTPIEELEKLMVDEEGSTIEILPNGDVVVTEVEKKPVEILMRRQDMGSNY